MDFKNRVVNIFITDPDDQGDATKFSKFRIIFDVEKSDKKDANKAVVEIYNVDQDTWALAVGDSNNLKLTIEAGYGDNVGQIFQGDITRIKEKRTANDTIYVIEALDSMYTIRNFRTSVSYAEGTNLKTIIDDMYRKLEDYSGIVAGNISTAVESYLQAYTIKNGAAFAGKIDDILDEITEDHFLIWRFEDGVLYIEDPFGANIQDTSVKITYYTGMIGSPEFYESGSKGKTKKGKKKSEYFSGVKCITLLNPFYKIYKNVELESLTYAGDYKIKKIKYRGDTHGTQWYAELVLV